MAIYKYQAVAAGVTDAEIGGVAGATQVLEHLLVIPATTSPGAVSIKDGSGSAITVFTGGAGSVPSLIPFAIPLNAYSTQGPWKVTTGANVSVIAVGLFN